MALLPPIVFPFLEWYRGLYSYGWTFIYIFLLFTGVCCILSSSGKIIITLAVPILTWFIPYTFYEQQKLYYDKVANSIETRMGTIDRVVWKGDEWIYYNGNIVQSSVDGHMLSEILVHPVMSLVNFKKVLLIGGETGYTLKEIEKYGIKPTHIPFDVEWAAISGVNLADFLATDQRSFDLIIIDLPDPVTLEYTPYYSKPFYELLYAKLSETGTLVTNAGNVHSYQKLYHEVGYRLDSLNWNVTFMQAQIPTLGQRAFYIASKSIYNWSIYSNKVETKWINKEAIHMMLSSGKKDYPF